METRKAPGASPVITPTMEVWLKHTVLNSTPVDHGYDTVLWTRAILVELLKTHVRQNQGRVPSDETSPWADRLSASALR